MTRRRVKICLAGSAAAWTLALCLAATLPVRPAAASSQRSACSTGNGRVVAIIPSSGGDELGFLTGQGRFRKLYRVPDAHRPNDPYSLSSPAFSCDGRQIAITQTGTSPWNALVVVKASSGVARLVNTRHRYGEHPTFLANGRIVFSSPNIHRVPGSNINTGHPGGTFIINPSGAHMRRLFGRQELAASSDGRWFIASIRDTLVLLNAQGQVVRRLTGPAPSRSEYVGPHFSLDGEWIVYEQRSPSDHGTLYLVRRDGTHRRQLAFGSESASDPTFSPDGRWVAFTRTRGSGPGGNLYAVSIADPHKVRKLGLSGGYRYPAWAPR